MLSLTLYHADALMKCTYIWYISVLSKRRVHKPTSYVRTNQYCHKSMGLLFRTAEQHESPGWELPHWFLPFVPFLHFFITIEAPFTFWLHITFILCRHSSVSALQWRHNGRNVVSNHRRLDCLLSRMFRRRSKKTSKVRVTGLCEGNSPVTGEFPAQRASNAENVSIWWRHHVLAAYHINIGNASPQLSFNHFNNTFHWPRGLSWCQLCGDCLGDNLRCRWSWYHSVLANSSGLSFPWK